MKKLLSILTVLLTFNSVANAAPLKIVALVNEEIISSEDLQNQIQSFLVNTHIPYNAQTQNMITQKALNNYIDEILKLQEAQKNDIVITDKEIKQHLNRFAAQNSISADKIPSFLKQQNLPFSVLKNQIRAELSWIRLVRKKYYTEGEPTQKEIEQALSIATKDLNTAKYMVSEIFIKKEHAHDLSLLVSNLRQDPRFDLYAMQFSDSPTASNGGNLGWVNQGRLASSLENQLKNMNEGDISEPILSGDGYYILKLQKTFNPKVDKIPQPSPANIKIMLENQKMELISKKMMQDLRQKAVIEIRG